MALQHLTDEQIATWTRAQKDEWWFKNIFRGDMAQLTLRSGLTGFLLGGVLSSTGLYIGAKTGISLGVGLTSVILAFALFRLFDIWKPWPVSWADQNLKGGVGVMTDDMIAGLMAGVLVALARYFFHI